MAELVKNIKYQQIIVAGKELFWKHGVKRVTVEEICTLAKVSKMTYYKYFKNKAELAISILENIIESAFKDYEKLVNSSSSFTDKVHKMLEMKIKGSKNVSKEFILDIYKNKELGLVPYIEQQQARSMKLTTQFIINSQVIFYSF